MYLIKCSKLLAQAEALTLQEPKSRRRDKRLKAMKLVREAQRIGICGDEDLAKHFCLRPKKGEIG
jgi:hypothetical protein